MSTSPDSELEFDLHFLPAWAQQSPDVNRYAQYQGEDEPLERNRDRRTRRPDRRERMPRRESQGRSAGRAPTDRPGREDREAKGRFGQSRREQRPETPTPLPDLQVTFVPEEKGVESLARQIKLTGRAYPLFEIAFLVLQKPERYHIQLSVVKTPDGRIAQPLFVCTLDETLWLSEQEALHHALEKHFATFYQMERTATDPPKGAYSFVAQCGLSGIILGPPNYHDYQNKLRRLHSERFSRMPFEAFKSRIKIVREEAVVKKWIEEQSWKTEYVCLNVPQPAKLHSREETEKHFRQTHLPNTIKSVESISLTGIAAQKLPSRVLQNLVKRAWEEQMHFPIKVVNVLSQQFAKHALQFFKVNRTVTHVSVARPRFLDDAATPISAGVKRIVEFINAAPNCNRRKLLEALAPSPAPAAAAKPGESAPAAVEPAAPTPEMAAVISDLHWLVHQGHVIEFSNGRLETAKQPAPKPAKPQADATAPATASAAVAVASAAADEPVAVSEAVSEKMENPAASAAPDAITPPAVTPKAISKDNAPAAACPNPAPVEPASAPAENQSAAAAPTNSASQPAE